MKQLYLASGSPRRRELLAQIGVPFTTISADIDETSFPEESPSAYVERLARGKAEVGAGRSCPTRISACWAPTLPWCWTENSRQAGG